MAFEGTYHDFARLLERPLKKGANTAEQNAVLDGFEKIVDGAIVQRNKAFFLKMKGSGEFEMGLVSEGYQKSIPKNRKRLLIILYLEGDFGRKTRRKKIIMTAIHRSAEGKLSWLECAVSVVDSIAYLRHLFDVTHTP